MRPLCVFLPKISAYRRDFDKTKYIYILTLFKMDLCGAADGSGGKKATLSKTCRTYPTTMKLRTVIPYLKKTQKIYELRDKLRDKLFFTGNQQILLYQEIQI